MQLFHTTFIITNLVQFSAVAAPTAHTRVEKMPLHKMMPDTLLGSTHKSTPSTSSIISKDIPSSTSTPSASSILSKDDLSGNGEIKGYYSLSWNEGNTGPKNSNTSVFFNGYNRVKGGLSEYDPENQSKLVGFKYFSFGGGNKNGALNSKKLEQYIKDIPLIVNAGFQGVMFDIEVVKESAEVMIPAFAKAFEATKKADLRVGITTSHSAPCVTKNKRDGAAFITAWVQDTNVDVISPQLYENGNEESPQFEPTGDCADYGCTYDLYKNMHGNMKFAPSITYASQYSKVQKHFLSNYGIKSDGYFVYFEDDDDRRLDDQPVIV
jgi:hypothetical protein